MQNFYSSFKKGTLWGLLFLVLGYISNYSLLYYLVTLVGYEEMGNFKAVTSYMTIVTSITTIGLPNALTVLLPRYLEKKKFSRARGVAVGLIALALVLSTLCSIILFFAIGVFHSDYESFWIYLPILIPLYSLVLMHRSFARGQLNIKVALVVKEFLMPFGLIVACFIFNNYFYPIISVFEVFFLLVIVLIVSLFFQSIYNYRNFYQNFSKKDVKAVYNWTIWLAVAMPFWLTDTSYHFQKQIDIVMIEKLVNSKEVGIYAIAVETAAWISLMHFAAKMIMPPIFSHLYNRGDMDDLQAMSSKMLWVTFPQSIVLSFIFIVFGANLTYFYGSEFNSAYWPIIILLVGEVFNCATGSPGWLLMATGHQGAAARIFLAATMFNILLNVPLILHFGIIGAAVSTAITLIFRRTLSAIYAYRLTGIDTTVLYWLKSNKA